MSRAIELTIPAFPTLRERAQTISLPKISVILGLNGSGKSKLLKEIEHQANLKNILVFYIQGNRFERAPYNASVSASHVESFKERLIEEFEKQYRNKDNGPRIDRAFQLLAARDFMAQKTYSDAVLDWYEGSRDASKEPQKPAFEIQKILDSISQLLPHIKFEKQKNDIIQAYYKKQGPYPVHDISDGEREIICNFIDIWVGIHSSGLLLIDEPELHLHSSLANNFWSLIERQFPNNTFLYATHSIGFALRAEVNKLFHIGKNGQLVVLPKNGSLTRQEKADFLGAIPGVLHSSRLLFCEGSGQEDSCDEGATASIDFQFYSWLLRNDSTKIQPMGSSSTVLKAMKSSEIFRHLSNDVVVGGVIDRDDYPDDALEGMAKAVEVLPYYEVESYLCEPELLIKIAKSKGIEIDQSSIIEILIASATAQIGLVTSRRFNQRSKKGDPDQLSRIMEEEKKRLQAAIDSRKLEEILRYFHGKELASKVASTVGCKDSRELLSSAIATVDPEEIHRLAALRSLLLNRLRTDPSGN